MAYAWSHSCWEFICTLGLSCPANTASLQTSTPFGFCDLLTTFPTSLAGTGWDRGVQIRAVNTSQSPVLCTWTSYEPLLWLKRKLESAVAEDCSGSNRHIRLEKTREEQTHHPFLWPLLIRTTHLSVTVPHIILSEAHWCLSLAQGRPNQDSNFPFQFIFFLMFNLVSIYYSIFSFTLLLRLPTKF